MPVELTAILLISLVVFLTHGLEAITGFGCTVLAFPLVLLISGDLSYTKIVLTVIAWLLALYFVITKFREIDWKQFLVIIGIAILGFPVGIYLFKTLDADILKKALGVFIVLTASIQLYKLFVSRRESPFRKIDYCYPFFGGIVHGAFATGGPLMVLYSTKKLKTKGTFRATMCLLWTTLNTFLIVQFLSEGLLTPRIQGQILVLMPALVLGIIAGEKIHHKVNELVFKKIVFAMLLATGVLMIFI